MSGAWVGQHASHLWGERLDLLVRPAGVALQAEESQRHLHHNHHLEQVLEGAEAQIPSLSAFALAWSLT